MAASRRRGSTFRVRWGDARPLRGPGVLVFARATVLVERGSPTRVGGEEGPAMPKFQVTVADEAGHKLYDESIEAPGPMEACTKAVADAKTADVAESEEPMDAGLVPPFSMDT